MGIGAKLDDLLKSRNITVSELSRMIGVTPSTIYSIIQRNNKKVDIDVLIKIANILGVPVEYFSDINSEPVTLAAHFDGTEYTESELEEIKEFANFVKSKRK